MTGALYSAVMMLEVIFAWIPIDEYGVVVLVGSPLILYLLVCAYVARGIRLVVLYDPRKRRKWARYIKERDVLQVLLGLAATTEIAAIAAIPVYGLAR